MVQSNYDTANQVVGVFRAEIKALPVKLSISTSTSLMEDFLDACQEFDFLTVPKVSEGPDKRFLDQCLFRSFIYLYTVSKLKTLTEVSSRKCLVTLKA